MTHALKTWPEFYKAIEDGSKTFEVRMYDRPFKVGDKLLLQEYDPNNKVYTGKESEFGITYILHSAKYGGLKKAYCVLGIKEIQGE